MRLIDADVRVTVQSFDPMNEEYSHDEMTVERALDFATDEGCPPIIYAIPVEWLEAQNNSTEYFKTIQGQAVELILELWHKEQEAR